MCILVCPLGSRAISWGASPEEKIVVDVEGCVYCGVCTYFCPVAALRLSINGAARIELCEDVDQIERHSLPRLDARFVLHKETRVPIRKILLGSLQLPAVLEESAIRDAIQACPTAAIKLPRAGDNRPVFEEEKCLFCDACTRSTAGKITVHRTMLLMDYKNGISPLMKRIIERMMGEQAANRIIKGVAGRIARERAWSIIGRSSSILPSRADGDLK